SRAIRSLSPLLHPARSARTRSTERGSPALRTRRETRLPRQPAHASSRRSQVLPRRLPSPIPRVTSILAVQLPAWRHPILLARGLPATPTSSPPCSSSLR